MASDLVFVVKAKTDSAASSFKKLASSILPIKKASDDATKSISKLDKAKISPKVDSHQIQKVKAEIDRLQQEMAQRLRLNVSANTSDIRKKITGLRGTLRELQRVPPVAPKINTGPITRGVATLKGKFATLGASIANSRIGNFAQRVASDLSTVGGIIGGLASQLGSFGSAVGGLFKSIGVPIVGAALAGVTALGIGIGITTIKALDLADSFERNKLQMEVFTGSVEATTKLLGQVQDYADQTPFAFPELAASSKLLLGIGIAADKVVPQLKKIGDIAALSGANVQGLTVIFQQMTSAGRLNAGDMNQLVNMGISAWPILAKSMGKTVAEVRTLSEQGKIGAKDIQKFWDAMATGAKGSTGKLAQTFGGMVSTLKDTVDGVLRDIGNSLLPFAKLIVPQMTKGVESIGDKILGIMPRIIDGIAAGLTALVDLPGVILRGLASVSQGFLFMIADIQAGLADLIDGVVSLLDSLSTGPLAILLGGANVDTSGLKAVSDSLRDAAVASSAKGGTLFENLTAQASKFDTSLRPLKGKIEEARKVAQSGIVLSVTVKGAQDNLTKLKADLDKINGTKAHPIVNAETKAAQGKIKTAQKWLDQLDKYSAHPEILAKDLASGKVKIVKGQLQSVPKSKNTDLKATDKTGAPTKSAKSNITSVPKAHDTALKAKDGVSGPAGTAKRAVNDIPTHHTTTLTITTVRKTKGGSSSAGAHTADPDQGATSTMLTQQAAQVSLYVRDEKLASLIDVRVNSQAARASRIIHRRDVIAL